MRHGGVTPRGIPFSWMVPASGFACRENVERPFETRGGSARTGIKKNYRFRHWTSMTPCRTW